MSFFGGTLIHITHTYTQKYPAHSGTNRLAHPYKYILTPPATCSQHLSVLHTEKVNVIKHVLSKMSSLFKNYSLVKVASKSGQVGEGYNYDLDASEFFF